MAPFSMDPQALARSVSSILPEIVVVATALLVLVLDVAISEKNRRALCWTSLLGIAAALCVTLFVLGPAKIEGFSGMIVHDGLGAFFDVVILAACALTLLM